MSNHISPGLCVNRTKQPPNQIHPNLTLNISTILAPDALLDSSCCLARVLWICCVELNGWPGPGLPPQKKRRDKLLQDGDPDQLLFSWIYLSLVIPIYNLWFFIGFAQFLSVVPTSQVTNEGFFVSLGKIKITASIKHLQFVFFSRLILEFWMSRESPLGKKVVFFQLFSSAVVFG